jgi:hypothetical protein
MLHRQSNHLIAFLKMRQNAKFEGFRDKSLMLRNIGDILTFLQNKCEMRVYFTARSKKFSKKIASIPQGHCHNTRVPFSTLVGWLEHQGTNRSRLLRLAHYPYQKTPIHLHFLSHLREVQIRLQDSHTPV